MWHWLTSESGRMWTARYSSRGSGSNWHRKYLGWRDPLTQQILGRCSFADIAESTGMPELSSRWDLCLNWGWNCKACCWRSYSVIDQWCVLLLEYRKEMISNYWSEKVINIDFSAFLEILNFLSKEGKRKSW
jgi:hypothetical protein